MPKLDLAHLVQISAPVMEQFSKVEPKPWERKTILLELLGELGTLAHHIQHWEGVKHGRSTRAELSDECSDVLFMLLRLACQDALPLPQEIDIPQEPGKSATDLALDLGVGLSRLHHLMSSAEEVDELLAALRKLGTLADLLGIDLVQAHELEMRIAAQSFAASGDDWPSRQFLQHPIATIRLWRLRWQRTKM